MASNNVSSVGVGVGVGGKGRSEAPTVSRGNAYQVSYGINTSEISQGRHTLKSQRRQEGGRQKTEGEIDPGRKEDQREEG